MQLYLEIQNAFSTWIEDQFILEDFYSQLLLEPVPDKHFLKPVQVIEVESKPLPAAKRKPQQRQIHFIHLPTSS